MFVSNFLGAQVATPCRFHTSCGRPPLDSVTDHITDSAQFPKGTAGLDMIIYVTEVAEGSITAVLGLDTSALLFRLKGARLAIFLSTMRAAHAGQAIAMQLLKLTETDRALVGQARILSFFTCFRQPQVSANADDGCFVRRNCGCG